MGKILSGSRGMSALVLAVLIAWALLSVIFLTGTLLAARSIDRSVSGVTNRTDASGKKEKNIATTVDEIKAESKFIAEARKTVQISTAIRKAAAPLSGHLARTLRVADQGIDPKLKSILRKVGDINATAGRINVNAKGIGSTVDSIGSSVSTIGSSARSINASVKSIGRSAVGVRSSASSINSTARAILGNLSAILARVKTIDGEALTINNRAQTIIDTARPIATDLNSVLKLVGTQNGSPTILGHANGIDCSTLLLNLLPAPSFACNK